MTREYEIGIMMNEEPMEWDLLDEWLEEVTDSPLLSDPQLLAMLECNAEQLTYYLENAVLDNPFIELEYSLEQSIPAFEHYEGSKQLAQMQATAQSLPTYLFEQAMLYRQTEIRNAMVKLIELLDEQGYLPFTTAELADRLEMDEVIVLDAVTLIQEMEPAGIGAYDLTESLKIQARRDRMAPEGTLEVLEKFGSEVLDHDSHWLIDEMEIPHDQARLIQSYLKTLRRDPASLFDRLGQFNIIPDVSVRYVGETLTLFYNQQYYTKANFNELYYEEMLLEEDDALRDYVEEHAANYQWLHSKLRLRKQLLLLIANRIVKLQRPFFEQTTEELATLSVTDVAQDLGLPEAIVYRAISNKALEFHQIVYAFTDFINVSNAATREGHRANYIKQRIYQMVQDASDELTDREIVNQLREENILIGEQVVQSYRKYL